jgi:phosphate starvation-inducible PhoH-like protein
MSSRRRRAQELMRDEPLPQQADLFFDPPKPRRTHPLEAQTDAQATYINAIKTQNLVFGLGPAGTGKTYVCGALAADALKNKQTPKLIVTRPAVEAGESLGFLPGELDQKFEPYLRPFRDVLNERLGAGYVDCAMKNSKIEAIPLAYLRGMTFKDCWVILDEAQNTTPLQMKLFLTRIGQNCKVIVNGDPSQKDIRGPSGLLDAIDRLRGLRGVAEVRFGRYDIVRSGLVQDIVNAYSDTDNQVEHEELPAFIRR